MLYLIPYQTSDICAFLILWPTKQANSQTLNLSITCLSGPVSRALWLCLISNSHYRNSNSLDLGDVWQYLSHSYDVFCHSQLCNLKPFSLNLGTRKERLLLLLANSDSEALMNAIRQENKILSANTGKRFFFCDEYDFISRKCKKL